MDERALLLLGMLKVQSQHGYQINEFIEQNLGRVTHMKKATAYAILDRLEESGLVEVTTKQKGNRPPRKVYSITEKGEKAFRELLKANLSAVHWAVSAGEIGLMFLDHLSEEEITVCLKRRARALDELIEQYEHAPDHEGIGVNVAFQRFTALLKADRRWFKEFLDNR